MQKLSAFGAVLLMALLMPVVPAEAQTVQALRDFGMIGTWAEDCSQPPNKSNWYGSYGVSADGAAEIVYKNSPDTIYTRYRFLKAQIVGSDRISMSVKNVLSNQRLDSVFQRVGDKIFVWSSFKDGTEVIKDGNYLINGRPTPRLTRCGA
jgi:hypothetical protein